MVGEPWYAPGEHGFGSRRRRAYLGAAAGLVTLACGVHAAAPVAPLAERARFVPCVEEPNEGLFGEWEGLEVRYGDGSPPTPLAGVVLAFSPGGYVGWDDGCNQHGGDYAHQGNLLSIRETDSTETACDVAVVELADVGEWRVAGRELELVSSRARYVFRRSPYSVLTRRPWSLFSITEIATGETHEIDRYRVGYDQLVIHTEADRRFTFTDFDNARWSGSMKVGPETHAVELAWDTRSKAALDAKRRSASDAAVRAVGAPYPLGVAAELDLAQVDAFCLVEHDSLFGPSLMLELRGDKYVYTLSPR